jgi:hypothetical protein
MKTTRHTLDATIPYNGTALLARVVYQYEPHGDGAVFLWVVDARVLQDGDEPAFAPDWAQDWLNCDGYDRARQNAESERAGGVS